MRVSLVARSVPLLLVSFVSFELLARAQAAELAPAPPSLIFAQQALGTVSPPQSVIWTNASGLPQTVRSLRITGPDAGDFTLVDGNAYPVALPSTAALDPVTVSFGPDSGVSGPRSASLEASMSDGSVIECPLSGTALGPQLTVAPDPLDLGGNLVGVPRTIDVTIGNGGGGVILLRSLSLQGPDGAEFEIVNPPVLPLPLGPLELGAVTFQLRFTPDHAGLPTASLQVGSDDPNLVISGGFLDVPCVARAGDPAITADLAAAVFPGTRVGLSSPPTPITFTNSGNSDLIISSVAIAKVADAGDFTVDLGGRTLPLTLAIGESLVVAASFRPTATGKRAGQVDAHSNDPRQPTLSVALGGKGTQALLTVAPPVLNFGDQQENLASATQAVLVSNTGDAAAHIESLEFSGQSWFHAEGALALPMLVPAMGSVRIPLFVVPLATGPATDALTIHTDDPVTATLPLGLSVNGVAASAAVDPPFIDLGAVRVGFSRTVPVTISNTGTSKLSVLEAYQQNLNDTTLTLSLPDALLDLPAFLDPGGSTTLMVTCAPVTTGSFTDELELSFAGDPNLAHRRVPLQCQGVQAQLQVKPGKLDFGVVPAGTLSPLQPITISNVGSADLAIKSIAAVGSNPDQFQLVLPGGAGSFTLHPAESRTVLVALEPLIAGPLAATFVVTPDDDALLPAMVKLAGIGAARSITAPSGPLTVPDAHLFEATRLTLTLRVPVTSLPVTISAITSTDPEFTIDTSKTRLDLLAGGSTTFDVVFRPTTVGLRTTAINVSSVGGSSGPLWTAQVVGKALPVTVFPGPHDGCATAGRDAASGWGALWLALGTAALLSHRRRRGSPAAGR